MAGILFDARVIRPGMTGIGNYAHSLLRALPASQERIGILLPEHSPFAGDFPGCTIHFTSVPLTSHPWTDLYEQFWIPEFCRRSQYDSFISFEGRVPFFARSIHTYALIYDLAYRKIAGTHGIAYRSLLRLSHWIAKISSAHIVTISESVREQIVKDLAIAADKIQVVYPSDSGLDAFSPLPTPGIRAPYLLATSMTNPRKNLGNLLKGFSVFRKEHPEMQLVLTGNPEWIAKCMRETNCEGVLNAGFVGEGQLRMLYANATGFVYPSFDEGFGIPLLDARLAGCPVACSDIPVFREVLEYEAEYFDPSSPEEMAAALAKVLEPSYNPEVTAVRKRFDWKLSATALISHMGKKEHVA